MHGPGCPYKPLKPPHRLKLNVYQLLLPSWWHFLAQSLYLVLKPSTLCSGRYLGCHQCSGPIILAPVSSGASRLHRTARLLPRNPKRPDRAKKPRARVLSPLTRVLELVVVPCCVLAPHSSRWLCSGGKVGWAQDGQLASQAGVSSCLLTPRAAGRLEGAGGQRATVGAAVKGW